MVLFSRLENSFNQIAANHPVEVMDVQNKQFKN